MKDGDVDIHSHFEFGHDVAAASLPTDIPVGDQLDDKWIAVPLHATPSPVKEAISYG